jgi:hypothetical protein
MEDVVVTETSLPLRIGVKTDNRGSALCLTVWIWRQKVSRCCMEGLSSTNLWDFIYRGSNQTLVLASSISMQMS